MPTTIYVEEAGFFRLIHFVSRSKIGASLDRSAATGGYSWLPASPLQPRAHLRAGRTGLLPHQPRTAAGRGIQASRETVPVLWTVVVERAHGVAYRPGHGHGVVSEQPDGQFLAVA